MLVLVLLESSDFFEVPLMCTSDFKHPGEGKKQRKAQLFRGTFKPFSVQKISVKHFDS